MTYASVKAIQVSIWNRVVGAVALDPQTNFYAFEFEDSWIAQHVELSPIFMPSRPGVFVFPDLSRETYYGLPAMVADALPDRFGNALVNAWMANQGVSEQQITPLDRLAYAGNRTMGALTFEPATREKDEKPSIVQIASLVSAARQQISGTLDHDGATNALQQLITVGSTAGGARAKAVIAYKPSTEEMLSGQLDAPEGFEQWLLKLDGVGDPTGQRDALVSSEQYCRVEYAYYLMASRAGIYMNDSRLLLEGPRAHFFTKRFDRDASNERIHMQSLCALAHLDYRFAKTHSSASWFITARQLGLGADTANQIFRRIAFNALAVNKDDHTKNVAFLLSENGTWELSPAFDLTHSNWAGEWTQGQQMSVNAKFEGITLDDLRVMADRFEVPDVARSLHEVISAIDQWNDFALEANVEAKTIERIGRDIAQGRFG